MGKKTEKALQLIYLILEKMAATRALYVAWNDSFADMENPKIPLLD